MEVPILKIPFSPEEQAIITQGLTRMLEAGQLAMGPHTLEFESRWARFCQVSQAVSVMNGTAALEVIYRALLKPGAVVAVPANTFLATALAAVAAGAKILFIDSDPAHGQMCPRDLAAKITPAVQAVVLVHIGGFISPELPEITAICQRNGSLLLEDAAHAHGAEAFGGRAGSFGRAAAFSFFPTKVLTTAEGGMITTSDGDLAERCRHLRQHGQGRPGSNVHENFGLNYRPSEIHALLGVVMMNKAEALLAERRRLAARYDQLLAQADLGLEVVTPPAGQKPAYYKYMALLPEGRERQTVKSRLKDQAGINLAGEVYAQAAHQQPLWAKHPEFLAAPIEPLPGAELIARSQICLPLYPGLTEAQQDYVVEQLAKALR